MITSADEFVRLRTSEVMEEYNRAAHDEATDEVWIDVIARFPDMKKWVAHNKTVPLKILELLSRDPDPEVRWYVATKRKATPEIMSRLADDVEEGVRHRIACNAKTPQEILERLAYDSSLLVAGSARERLRDRFGSVTFERDTTSES